MTEVNQAGIIETSEFENFGSIIDHIFGIETSIFLEEQDALLRLFDGAILGEFDEKTTTSILLDFLDDLDDYTLDLLIRTTGMILKPILENVSGLSKGKKKRYKKIL